MPQSKYSQQQNILKVDTNSTELNPALAVDSRCQVDSYPLASNTDLALVVDENPDLADSLQIKNMV